MANAETIRKWNVDMADMDVGGTGAEDEFRNLLLREIAAQLAELNAILRRLGDAGR